MTEAEQKLTLASARLSRHQPELWQQFVDSLKLYSASQTLNLLQSPQETLQLMQGRAQGVAHVHGILSECQPRADKIESKKNETPNPRR